ncbi:MAG: hypothetical protein ACKVQA_13870 [Burkholderiales bacterium]
MKKTSASKENEKFYSAVMRAMKRAALRARQVARMHGTRIYLWENGKVVAKKP